MYPDIYIAWRNVLEAASGPLNIPLWRTSRSVAAEAKRGVMRRLFTTNICRARL